LAKRVESIFVEKSEWAVSDRLDLCRKDLGECLNRVVCRSPCKVLNQKVVLLPLQTTIVETDLKESSMAI
jgi:hypothetical protein